MIRILSTLVITFLFAQVSFSQTIFPGTWDGKLYVKIKDVASQKFLPDSINASSLNFTLDLQPFIAEYGLTTISKPFEEYTNDVGMKKTYMLEFSDNNKVVDFTLDLQQLAYVEYVELIPIDNVDCTTEDAAYWSTPSKVYHLNNISACPTWTGVTSGNSSIVVAVVDNEFEMTHPDLINKLSGLSYDVADNDANTTAPWTSGFHGTYTAGVVGAEHNNAIGIAGVGGATEIMAIKATTDVVSQQQFVTHGYQGILYAVQNNADVISISWGTIFPSITNQNVIDVARSSGAVIVASAGNKGGSGFIHYPAAYNNVIAVGSVDVNDIKSVFSSVDPWVDIMAPGTSIYTTVPILEGSYGFKNGTSYSAPLVAGVCALIKSVNSNLSPTDIENCLLSTADNIDALNPSWVGSIGSGRVNALNAVNCALTTNTQDIVDFNAQYSIACPNEPISLFDNSTLTGAVLSYTWSFSCPVTYLSSTNQNSQNPVVSFSSSGSCDVTLTVNTSTGTFNKTKSVFLTISDLSVNLTPISIDVCAGTLQQVDLEFSGGTPPYSANIIYDGISYNINSITGEAQFFYTAVAGANTVRLTNLTTNTCSNTNNQIVNISSKECCDNLIVNGDFSQGNVSFSSEHAYSVGPPSSPNCTGYYFVGEYAGATPIPGLSIPDLEYRGINMEIIGAYEVTNSQPVSCPLSNLLPATYTPLNAFNGTVPSHGETVWEQSGIQLNPNTDYHFDFHTTEGNPPYFLVFHPSFAPILPLQFRVIISQGATVYYTSPIIQDPYTELHSWQQHSLKWSSGAIPSGSYSVKIEQYENFGNPLAGHYVYLIDDISLREEPTYDYPTGITITSANNNWSGVNYKINGNVVIEDNVTLTIDGGSVIEFGPEGAIINGSKFIGPRIITNELALVINNATLTGLIGCHSDNHWKGINLTGRVNLNQVTIENAERALQVNSVFDLGTTNFLISGKLDVTNSAFRNNQVGIVMDNNIFVNTVSHINVNATIFENTAAIPSSFINRVPFISLASNMLTNINGNTFNNNGVFTGADRPIAINYYYRRNPRSTDIVNNTFTDLQEGVIARNSRAMEIYSNTFVNVDKGILLEGGELDEISNNNSFTIADANNNDTYGVRLIGTSGTLIENNTFAGTGGNAFDSYGVIVENTGVSGSTLFDNGFSGTDIGVQTQGDNPAFKIRCNSFATSGTSHNIAAWTTLAMGATNTLKLQGIDCSPTTGSNINENQAGNEWLDNCGTGATDIMVASGISFGYKAHELNSSSVTTTQPNCSNYNATWVANDLQVCFVVNKTSSSCNDLFAGKMADPDSDFETYVIDVKTLIVDYKNEVIALENTVDGGDSENLLNITNTQSSGNVKNALLLASPYLSDELLIAYINTNPAAGNLKQVIIANSPLSNAVMQAINSMSLPKGIRNQINAAQTGISDRVRLEQQIGGLTAEVQLLINDLQRRFIRRNEKPREKLLLTEMNDAESQKKLANIYLAEGDLLNAQATIDIIALEPTTLSCTETQECCKLANCMINVVSQDRTIDQLTTSEVQIIESVATTNTKVAVKAQTILLEATQQVTYYPIAKIPSGASLRKGIDDEENSSLITSYSTLKMYPNPTTGLVRFEYDVLQLGKVSIVVYNILGERVMSNSINDKSIDLSHLNNGVYFINIVSSANEIIDNQKLIIQK